MRNTCMIQRATLQLCTHGSVDIRTFATSTSETTTVTSNVAIDLSDDVEIHETHVKSEQASSDKSDLSSNPDIVSVLQGMFLPEVLDEILSAEDPVFLNRVLKNMKSDGLGSYSDIDQARYVSLKSYRKDACPGLILSNNASNRYGEILGTFRSLRDLSMIIGLSGGNIGISVEGLRKAGFDGVKFRNDHLAIRLILPADTMTLEQVSADCANDSGKNTTLEKLVNLASTELLAKKRSVMEEHGHVKIVCKAMYKDPPHSRIFKVGTASFSTTYLSGKGCLFHVASAMEFGSIVAKGRAKGATFPITSVRSGVCKGKQYPAFSAFIVNPTTGKDLTEEEYAQANRKKSKK